MPEFPNSRTIQEYSSRSVTQTPVEQQSHRLTGFRLQPSDTSFAVEVREDVDADEIRTLREQYGNEWFITWSEGRAYGIPNVPQPQHSFGEPKEASYHDHFYLIARRITERLPRKFPWYDAIRQRPFTFVGRKGEIITQVGKRIGGLPSAINGFTIYPKFTLDVRLVELVDGQPFLGVFVSAGTRWNIHTPLDELQAAGVNLRGLYVLRRRPKEGERRLVGRLDRIEGERAILSESFEGLREVPTDSIKLEPSRSSFTRSLETILGRRYERFETERQKQERALLTGPATLSLMDKMGSLLQKVSPIEVAPGLSVTVGDPIDVANADGYRSVFAVPPVEYCFDPARTKRERMPWPGLGRYGPFSRDTFAAKTPRLLVLFPERVQGPVERFLRLFRDGIQSSGRRSRYAAGFAGTFGLGNVHFTMKRIRLDGAASPAEAYRTAITEAIQEGPAPTAAIVALLDEQAFLPDNINPYLHAKALLLTAGIPVQQIRLSKLSQGDSALQYLLQNISIALYAKMGGTPWTVNQDLTIHDELVMGIGTAELSGSRFTERQRFVGITTVFRGDGNYLLSNLSEECAFDEYPHILRKSTTRVLREIKDRNGWRSGDTVRLVFHAPQPFRKVDMARIMVESAAEVGSEQNVEFAFLTVSQRHPFGLLDLSQTGIRSRYGKGRPKGVYVPERGTIVQIGRWARLLATNGPRLVKLEGAPLPHPLRIHLLRPEVHRDLLFRDLHYLTEQVLKFTSLSWRSTLPARLPVTIYYSEIIARNLVRLRGVPDFSPAMLNVKLRASRWFL